ncbi:MSC_0623 family F1-like ATPase-associated protein [Mycoplasma sp. AC157]
MKKLFKEKQKEKVNKKEEQQLMIPFYDVEQQYKEMEKSDKFVSYERLMSSLLLTTGLSFDSDIVKEYVANYEKAIVKKYDLVYLDFILSFGLSDKFGSKFFVPILVKDISSNNEHINFKFSEDLAKENFLVKLNEAINDLIARNLFVEFLPGIILYFSQQSKSLKLVFKINYAARIKK